MLAFLLNIKVCFESNACNQSVIAMTHSDYNNSRVDSIICIINNMYCLPFHIRDCSVEIGGK